MICFGYFKGEFCSVIQMIRDKKIRYVSQLPETLSIFVCKDKRRFYWSVVRIK